jgi:cytochrome c6
LLKFLFILGLALLLIGATLPFQDFALAAASTDGAQIFEVHCAGCHVNGGNIVRRGKTLKLKALEKNQVNSLEAIEQLVANGKGIMSAYRDRLTEDEIESVAAYVLEQAQTGWHSP